MTRAKKIAATFAIASALVATMPGLANAGEKYVIHEDHTWVSFKISHAGWANAHGTFRKVSGDISFDKENVSQSSVSVVIDATSLDTNSAPRDKHVSSPDFLNSEKFPEITFESTKIEPTGETTGLIYGNMTMVGVTREVVLDAQWNAETPLPWDASTIKTGFSASATIDGADFGMNKLAEFGIGPEIHVTIDVEAIKQ